MGWTRFCTSNCWRCREQDPGSPPWDQDGEEHPGSSLPPEEVVRRLRAGQAGVHETDVAAEDWDRLVEMAAGAGWDLVETNVPGYFTKRWRTS